MSFMLSPIVFLHIPKTAGSTVATGLKNISEKNANINYYRSTSRGIVSNFSTKYFSNIDLSKDKNILTGHLNNNHLVSNTITKTLAGIPYNKFLLRYISFF